MARDCTVSLWWPQALWRNILQDMLRHVCYWWWVLLWHWWLHHSHRPHWGCSQHKVAAKIFLSLPLLVIMIFLSGNSFYNIVVHVASKNVWWFCWYFVNTKLVSKLVDWWEFESIETMNEVSVSHWYLMVLKLFLACINSSAEIDVFLTMNMSMSHIGQWTPDKHHRGGVRTWFSFSMCRGSCSHIW
jgi:hypothetical protein